MTPVVSPAVAAAVAAVAGVAAASSLTRVGPDERAVVAAPGRRRRVLDPGLHLVVPFVAGVESFVVEPHRVELDARSYPTADGERVSPAVCVEAAVTDVLAAHDHPGDPVETTRKAAARSLRNVLRGTPEATLRETPEAVATELHEAVAPAASDVGVRVTDVAVE